MQGGRHGSRDDIGVFDRVDAVRGVGAVGRVRWRSHQSGRRHNSGFVRQVEHMLESSDLHRTEHAGELE